MSNEVIILNGYKIVRFLNLLAECGNVLVGSLKISLGDIKLFIRYNTHLSWHTVTAPHLLILDFGAMDLNAEATSVMKFSWSL